ncbi:MAG: thermonuclease family protein [Desulfovibrio sp.]|jgi:endonuclease YncB( thermonuclease family)|nr:thermonuclease family protein [Desulfovibrio sp.]
MKKFGSIILPALVLCALCAGQAAAYQAKVKNVHDGDSIAVYGPDEQVVHVRLYGIDAPEFKQPYGYQAKTRLRKLASRKTLEIEPVDTDRYGRTVALVYDKDGRLLNEAMVADGLAWVYEKYCQKDICEGLRQLEAQARQERRGLWADPAPQRPEDWRREHKSEEWYAAPVRAVKTIARKITGVFK